MKLKIPGKEVLIPWALNRLSEFSFYLFIILIPWQARYFISIGSIKGAYWEYGTFSIFAIDLVIIILAALALINLAVNQSRSHFRFPAGLGVFILVWLIWLILNSYLALDPELAYYRLWTMLMAILVFLSVFFIPWKKHILALAIIIASLWPAGLGFWQFISQRVYASTIFGIAEQSVESLGVSVIELADGRFLRIYGSLAHPNVMGGLMVMGIISAIYLYATINRKFYKIIIIPLSFILMFALILTFSRSAVISLVVVLSIWAGTSVKFFTKAHLKEFSKIVVLLVVVAIILGIIMSDQILSRASTESRLENISYQERILAYKEWPALMENRWLKGLGLNNYTKALAEKDMVEKPAWTYQPFHNGYILVLAEIGSIGFLLMMTWLLGVFFGIANALKQGFWHVGLGMSLLFTILIISLFDHYWWSSHFGIIVFWLILGINYRFLYTETIS